MQPLENKELDRKVKKHCGKMRNCSRIASFHFSSQHSNGFAVEVSSVPPFPFVDNFNKPAEDNF